jgi:hypothetical protein
VIQQILDDLYHDPRHWDAGLAALRPFGELAKLRVLQRLRRHGSMNVNYYHMLERFLEDDAAALPNRDYRRYVAALEREVGRRRPLTGLEKLAIALLMGVCVLLLLVLEDVVRIPWLESSWIQLALFLVPFAVLLAGRWVQSRK